MSVSCYNDNSLTYRAGKWWESLMRRNTAYSAPAKVLAAIITAESLNRKQEWAGLQHLLEPLPGHK